MAGIRKGLAEDRPIGTCLTCTARRDAFYRPFNDSEKLMQLETGTGAPRRPAQ